MISTWRSRPDQSLTVRLFRPLTAGMVPLSHSKGSRYSLSSALLCALRALFSLLRAECPKRLFDATGLSVVNQ